MTTETAPSSKSVKELRLEFDNTFAAPPPSPGEECESLLTLRVGGEALTVRTLHVSGVAKRSRIVPIPTRVPWLLGIAAIRGVLLPVYDLAALLGLSTTGAEGSWLMLTGKEAPMALIFDEFEGQVETPHGCLYQSEGPRERAHLRLVARIGTAHRAVIDIPGIVEQIRKTAGLLEPVKE